MTYILKSGQINFERENQCGSFTCIVIKDGVFHNMQEKHAIILEDTIKHWREKYNAPEQGLSLEELF